MKTLRILFLILSLSFCFNEADAQLNFAQFTEEWRQFIEHKQFNSEGNLSEEFALLEAFSDRQLPRQRPFLNGMDRFPEWVPFRENRVRLDDGTEMSASFIRLSDGDHDSFIASQAPLNENRHLYWRMVWEQGVDQIVMTTELHDVDGDELSIAYWPENDERLLLETGIEVYLLEEKWLFPGMPENIQIRTFRLCHQDQTRFVTHYWYHNWLDNCLPDLQTALAFVETVQRDKSRMNSKAKILGHCAAGVGRTGVFIALYHMMQVEEPVSLFELVARLRWQRPEMVGVLEQYEFCHRAKHAIVN